MQTNISLPGSLFAYVPNLGRLMFSLAVQLLAPVLALLFLTQVALGLVARAVPQIQIMIVGFPLTIAVGFIFLSLTLMGAGPSLVDQFVALKTPLTHILGAWKD